MSAGMLHAPARDAIHACYWQCMQIATLKSGWTPVIMCMLCSSWLLRRRIGHALNLTSHASQYMYITYDDVIVYMHIQKACRESSLLDVSLHTQSTVLHDATCIDSMPDCCSRSCASAATFEIRLCVCCYGSGSKVSLPACLRCFMLMRRGPCGQRCYKDLVYRCIICRCSEQLKDGLTRLHSLSGVRSSRSLLACVTLRCQL